MRYENVGCYFSVLKCVYVDPNDSTDRTLLRYLFISLSKPFNSLNIFLQDDSDDYDSEDDDADNQTSKNTKITRLLDNLDPQLRQKVIMGKGGDALSEESDEDDDDDEDAVDGLRESSGWGKKGNYWSGDTADLEIGQDEQDAEDEEVAAKVGGERRGTVCMYIYICVCDGGRVLLGSPVGAVESTEGK